MQNFVNSWNWSYKTSNSHSDPPLLKAVHNNLVMFKFTRVQVQENQASPLRSIPTAPGRAALTPEPPAPAPSPSRPFCQRGGRVRSPGASEWGHTGCSAHLPLHISSWGTAGGETSCPPPSPAAPALPRSPRCLQSLPGASLEITERRTSRVGTHKDHGAQLLSRQHSPKLTPA